MHAVGFSINQSEGKDHTLEFSLKDQTMKFSLNQIESEEQHEKALFRACSNEEYGSEGTVAFQMAPYALYRALLLDRTHRALVRSIAL